PGALRVPGGVEPRWSSGKTPRRKRRCTAVDGELRVAAGGRALVEARNLCCLEETVVKRNERLRFLADRAEPSGDDRGLHIGIGEMPIRHPSNALLDGNRRRWGLRWRSIDLFEECRSPKGRTSEAKNGRQDPACNSDVHEGPPDRRVLP